MEKENKDKRVKRLSLLGAAEHGLVLYDALHDKDLTKFFFLLKQGYGLSPFILNVMIDFGYEKNLVKALEICELVDFKVYDFLCAYWGQEKAENFLVEKDFKNIIKKMFPAESLVKYQFWNILVDRKEYAALTGAGKFDVIKEVYFQNAACREEICKALLEAADDCHRASPVNDDVINAIINTFVELEEFDYLSHFSEGVFKLLELRKWSFLPYHEPRLFGKKTRADVWQLIYDNGGEDFLYNHATRERTIFKVEILKFLIENKYYNKFIADKDWCNLALYGAEEAIDWEDCASLSDDYCGSCTETARLTLLARYHKRMLLFKNKRFGWWLKSFIM